MYIQPVCLVWGVALLVFATGVAKAAITYHFAIRTARHRRHTRRCLGAFESTRDAKLMVRRAGAHSRLIVALAGLVVMVISVLGIWYRFGRVVVIESPELKYRPHCEDNLYRIVTALHRYHEVHGQFPPLCVTDADGRPMHSWRVFLLPYLGYEDLYRRYRFDEPWDGPTNRVLGEMQVEAYCCPSASGKCAPNTTSYVALIGGGVWSCSEESAGYACGAGVPTRPCIAEAAGAAIPWSAPRDVHLSSVVENGLRKDTLSSYHFGGDVAVAFDDGVVIWLSPDITCTQIREQLCPDVWEAGVNRGDPCRQK